MAQPNRINHEPIFLLASAPWRESSLWVEAFSRRYGRVALLGQKRAQTAERIARRVGAVCAGERILVWFARVEDPASRRMGRRLAAAAGQGFVLADCM